MSTPAAAHEIRTARVMPVTPEQVWSAWVAPAAIARWWGPAGFVSTVNVLDLRAGGRFDVVMHGPDGTDYANLYLVDAVDPGRALTYTNQGSAEHGLAPFVSVVTIDALEPDAGAPRTEVTLVARFTTDEDWRRHVEDFGAIEGAHQLLARLEAVASEQEVGQEQ